MDIQKIKEGIDLPDVVESAGIELKRSGSRYLGCCPFHEDKQPSFVVFPDGRFHCFGCGAHGDVFDFTQAVYGCGLKEAMALLGVNDVKPSTSEEWKRIEAERKAKAEFEQWRRRACDEVSTLCRVSRLLLAEIRDVESLEKYGVHYHGLPSYEYHLSILTSNDDQAKQKLRAAGYDG